MTDTFLRLQADAILAACVASPNGIIVNTNDALRAKQILYRFRKELAVDAYLNIQIRFSIDAPKSQLWLIKRSSKEEAKEDDVVEEPRPESPSIDYSVNLDLD